MGDDPKRPRLKILTPAEMATWLEKKLGYAPGALAKDAPIPKLKGTSVLEQLLAMRKVDR